MKIASKLASQHQHNYKKPKKIGKKTELSKEELIPFLTKGIEELKDKLKLH